MEAKDFKYNNEEIIVKFPKDSIVCNGCKFAKPNITDGDRVVMYGYKGMVCEKYPKGNKPHEVLWQNGDCKYKQN